MLALTKLAAGFVAVAGPELVQKAAGRIECEGLRSIRWLLGVEHIVLVADVNLRLRPANVPLSWSTRKSLGPR